VRRTLAGERDAFTELVSRHRGMVYGMAYHSLGNPEEAQDAAQEAFVHAYVRLRDLRDPAKFAPWLRRAALNACADQRRRRLPTGPEEAARAHPPPEGLTTRLLVRDALDRLSEKTRLTVTLFYLGGYSHAEIARFLEIPLNTVRSRLQHAKRQLREEMMTMVDEVVNEGKPDAEWTHRVVEEALERGEEAYQSYRRAEAVRHYDEALTALDALPPGPEQKRLTMQALRQKERALDDGRNHDQALTLLSEALAVAQEIGDRTAEAQLRQDLGVTYVGKRAPDKAEDSFRDALAIYQRLGDIAGQGECLLSLGMHAFTQDQVEQGRQCFESALPLLAQSNRLDWSAVCRAMLDLLAEAGDTALPRLLLWRAVCDTLRQTGGKISSAGQPGFSITRQGDADPPALFIGSVFWQISHLRVFLDTNATVGDHWAGESSSFSDRPLQATVRVLSDDAQVMTPAGAFSGCLVTEQTTTQAEPSEGYWWRQLNAIVLCGTARAWYAPGVGLVQLRVKRDDGAEAMIQLQEYFVSEGASEYLPLAVGNTWTYGWANTPEKFVAKEVYRVAAHQGDLWYLEHYAFADRGTGGG